MSLSDRVHQRNQDLPERRVNGCLLQVISKGTGVITFADQSKITMLYDSYTGISKIYPGMKIDMEVISIMDQMLRK